MKISVLLPYKENFSEKYAGAVSLFVKDTVKNSKYFNTTYVFGNSNYKKTFLKNYINVDLKKFFFQSSSREYVKRFIDREKIVNSDFIEIIHNAAIDNLKKVKIKWKKEKSMTIVLCSKGYPGNYKKDILISEINKIKFDKKIKIYHAGTKLKDGNVVSAGGRVLNFTSMGNSFFKIRKAILKSLRMLNWEAGFFRKDIGWRVINKR